MSEVFVECWRIAAAELSFTQRCGTMCRPSKRSSIPPCLWALQPLIVESTISCYRSTPHARCCVASPRSHAPPRPTCTFWCAEEVCQRAQARSARQVRVFVCSRTISTHRRAKRPHLDSSRRDSVELYHFSRLRSENKPPCEARASSSDMRASHTGVSAPCAADLWPSPGP